ncbi:protein turtle homolog A-like, partial [Rhincodon typus]|uniref:protein turtle homolog A-like n=1 Tax=Rhincodon typus TaxID=259920 RepID=UPI00202EEEA5
EGSNSPGQFQVLEDGTLFFRSIRKDHHGTWTCKASDNLTEITASTMVWVTGTSPHSVTNLTVRPDVFAVNVSWEPGFDGGHPQHFTVWFRQISRGSHDWIIRMVPDGHCSLSVDHLWSNTSYQFSVLAQSDRGSGPFSQIVNTHTLSVPAATAAPRRPPAPSDGPHLLLPPRDLVANRTARGVVLRWSAPPSPSRLPLAYVLEFRHRGAWAVLHSAIPAQEDQLLLMGLVKDVSYQFRMISLRGELVSEPSDIVNISTSGMSSYPSEETIWEPFTHSVRAGIIAGVCFLTSAFIISILVSHVMRCRRQRRMQNVPIIFSRYQKSPNIERSDSPDSL